MTIKVIAQRREVKLGKNPGKKFVMRRDLYIPVQEKSRICKKSIIIHGYVCVGRKICVPLHKFSLKPNKNETEESVDGCADVVQHDSCGGTDADAADSR